MTETLKNLKDGITTYNVDLAKKAAEEVIALNLPPLEAISELTMAMREVGKKFAKFECFLADMMIAADAMNAALSVILPKISKEEIPKMGKILIGTVKGDIHDIGKNIVIVMLAAEGFEVHDLGKDVSPSKFAEEAEKLNPDIVAASALMATTKPVMAEIIEYFKAIKIRDRFKIMIGGAPLTQEYSDEIGADGYAPDAVEAAKLAKKLIDKL